jgi:hypothetical protein
MPLLLSPFTGDATTDGMCGLCGVLLSDHWADDGATRRARLSRVELINHVLGRAGLELRDWSGSVYVLRDRKGSQVVVGDLGSVWQEAERLAGAPLDPLDPDLLDRLEHA